MGPPYPAGADHITARDGRSFINDLPEANIEAFEANGIDLPIDYEHANDNLRAKLSGPIPAAGWIKELAARADGIWGRVDWTDRARAMISAREYRFLSPTIVINKHSKKIVRLKGAGLVHNPALHITALASEQETMPTPDFLTRLAVLLNLEEGATEDDILAAFSKRLSGKPDPRDYAPTEAFREQFEELATLREEKARGKVEAAIAQGTMTPAAREWAVELCLADEASFDTFVAKSGRPYAHLFEKNTHLRNPRPGSETQSDVTPEVQLLCDQLGLTPDRFD